MLMACLLASAEWAGSCVPMLRAPPSNMLLGTGLGSFDLCWMSLSVQLWGGGQMGHDSTRGRGQCPEHLRVGGHSPRANGAGR